MNPRVKKVAVGDNYNLILTFTNGQKKSFDMKPYLNIGVFKVLRQPEKFKKVKTFMGTICWPGGQDLCPDTLYELGKPFRKDR
jgi:hypothetical protein